MKHKNTVSVKNGFFYDDHDRVRIFRGATIGGVITPSEAIAFTGRPFPEEEADSRFLKLSSAGITLLRWAIPWEAVEYNGPGQYDEDYLAYTRRLLKKAEEYNLSVIIELCLTAWGRINGGYGAPAWTVEFLGVDFSRIESSGAATTLTTGTNANSDFRVNYQRYLCQTMFTLFYGGNIFAPHCKFQGEPVQDFLQEHYINAVYHTMRRLKDCAAIIGVGLPMGTTPGYIGTADLTKTAEPLAQSGIIAAPFEGMKAASGYAAQFETLKRPFLVTGAGIAKKQVPFNSGSETGSLFSPDFQCPWITEGVWSAKSGTPELLKPDYFARHDGKPVSFINDMLKPFYKNCVDALRAKHPEYLYFASNALYSEQLDYKTVPEFDKTFIVQQLPVSKLPGAQAKTDTKPLEETCASAVHCRKQGLTPCVTAFAPASDNGPQEQGVLSFLKKKVPLSESVYTAINESLLSSTISGLDVPVLPYAVATAGIPVKMRYTAAPQPVFEFEWDSVECPTDSGDSDTELYIPKSAFPKGWTVEKFDGVGQIRELPEQQQLYIKTLETRRSKIRIVGRK